MPMRFMVERPKGRRVRHMTRKRFPDPQFNGIFTTMTTIEDTAPQAAGSVIAQSLALLRAMRPLHWMKNGLVFVPILLAHELFVLANFLHGAIAFLALSLCASTIYLLNDLVDIESDRKHPKKRERPLASGVLSKSTAYVAVPVLILAAFGLALLLPEPLLFATALTAYLGVALIYVFYFKRKLLLDVLCLAGLHTLRIVAGSIAADIPQSSWLLAFSVFLFFSLALVKRYSELRVSDDDRGLRSRGRGYQKGDLDILSQMGIASGSISALIMALYVDSAAVKEQYATPELIWLICPIVLYVVTRIWVLAHRGEVSDDPVVFIMKDWRSHLMGVVIVAIMIAAA
jgi:4-hydroxybenzoate polyprenyltransferase